MFWLGLVVGLIVGGAAGWGLTWLWFKKGKVKEQVVGVIDKSVGAAKEGINKV